MAWRRTGDKPLPETMLTSSLTHIYGTRGRWVQKSQRMDGQYIPSDPYSWGNRNPLNHMLLKSWTCCYKRHHHEEWRDCKQDMCPSKSYMYQQTIIDVLMFTHSLVTRVNMFHDVHWYYSYVILKFVLTLKPHRSPCLLTPSCVLVSIMYCIVINKYDDNFYSKPNWKLHLQNNNHYCQVSVSFNRCHFFIINHKIYVYFHLSYI